MGNNKGARLAYSKAEYEHIFAIVMRMDYFRADDREILEELRQHYPNMPPNYDVLRNIRRRIKKKNLKDYSVMRKSNDNFISLIMQKFKNFSVIRNAYLQIYQKQGQTDFMKMKVLGELRTLDKDETQMLQDLPYLTEYHNDIRSDLDTLNTDIAQNNKNAAEQNIKDKPVNVGRDSFIINNTKALPVNGVNNTTDDKEKATDPTTTRIPIEEISENKEIQNILQSRDQSGFTRSSQG